MKHLSIFSLSIFLFFISCNDKFSKFEDGMYANIETNKGDIIVKLEFEKTPITVANFVSLTEGKNPFVSEEYKGKPFYDGLIFHRVIPDFMIQGGDPAGDGSGNPGYKFKDEFHPDLKHNKGGILSMANAGPKTNGSQFFITHKETPWLDNVHTVFGEVVEGKQVVDSIQMNDTIKKITIVRKGADAKKFDAVKTFKDYYSVEAEVQKKEAEQQKLEAIKVEETKKIKAEEIATLKNEGTKTKSGLIYKILKKGEGTKPKKGTKVFVNYAGFLQSGELFDSNYEDVSKAYGKYDANRAQQKGYNPFPFEYGNKQGLISGFIEAIELLSFGDKIIAYIPSKLAYGSQGAGNVIPPDTDIIFEIEITENLPN
ncbi:peptidylprolyl isomerase [Flavobacterium jejuense]|uniref:peptidylprolyl isomerase n=1 Tax=Flavobacterium jejuense TaxID=1544455 RepID=A0ABX0ILM6_9FLAO|nr:peptidylprolyl isomerase [Flavobacterium jejuense]NHN24623.1 peptidylprolyl isomerase [Flavobacterium jejuense]